MSMPKSKYSTQATADADADVATNLALLSHAEASRLAKSWLSASLGPPASSTDDSAPESTLDLAVQPHSDTAGLGFTATGPDDGAARAASASATERLRRQMLGKGHAATTARPRTQQGGGFAAAGTAARRRPQQQQQQQADDEEDDDQGRSGLGTRKDSNQDRAEVATDTKQKTKKRGSSYLDEILAGRSKKKKTKGKGGKDVEDGDGDGDGV